MDMSLYLSALINVFNVVPAFLLPVFSNGVQFFFQVLDNDEISRFEEADLSQFTEKNVYQILDHRLYKPGSPAVYGIDLPNGKYTYGGSRKIADVYFSNLPNVAEYPDFTQSMRDFLKEMGIGENRCVGHEVPAVLADVRTDVRGEHLPDQQMLEELIDSKLSKFDIILRHLITSTSSFLEVPSVSADIVAERVAHYRKILSARAQQKVLKNPENDCWIVVHNNLGLVQAGIVENAACAICKPDKSFIETNDIFAFRRLIKDPDTRHIAQYDKLTSEIPVKLQLNLLDVLFQYTPEDYTPPFGKHRPCLALWDYHTAFQVYDSMRPHSVYTGKERFRPYLTRLGLHIELPKQSASDDEPDSVDNCLTELLSSIEETANMEDAQLFWFEAKTLSRSVYAMLARDYETGRNCFRLKEDSLSSEDLIDFIVALNHDVQGKKVMLIRLRSEQFPQLFDDRLSDWLSENEDKCVIHDVYHDIRGYYE